MEYPGAKFTRPIRVGMLLLFVAVFFLIAPTVILYSAGYRYDFRNGLLKETGSISIDVLPRVTTAYLDGVKIDQQMPVRLNNITPHKYTLRLSAPGYYDWEKQIEVNNNQTTYIKEMILLKKERPKLVTKDTPARLAVSNSGQYLAYTLEGKNETSVFIWDQERETSLLSRVLPTKENLELNWSPNGNYLAVSYVDKPGMLLIISASTNKIMDLNDSVNKPILRSQWSKGVEPQIYYSNADGIYSFLPKLQQTSLITSNIYQDWHIESGLLWTLRFNTTTLRLDIVQDTLGFKNVFATISPSENQSSSSLLKLSFADVYNRTVVLKDQENSKYNILRQNESYTVPGDHILISRYNNWLLAWTPWELWTYSEGDKPFLLNRSGTELQDVQPLDQFNTLGFKWNNEYTALYPYFYTERTLVDRSVKAAAADPVSRTLYYSIASGLWKLSY